MPESTTIADNRPISEIIAEKIHANFIAMFPEEKFKELVTKQINYFTQARSNGYGEPPISPFDKMVRNEIEKQLTSRLVENIQTVIHEINPYDKTQSNEALKKLVTEMMPSVAQILLTGLISATVQQAQNAIARPC